MVAQENSAMGPEVRAAVRFLTSLVRQRCKGMAASNAGKSSSRKTEQPSEATLSALEDALTDVLVDHYADHWFPGQPWRGGAYRCIRINGKIDPLVARAGSVCALEPARLRAYFPPELTVWIDPGNVSYRIGEEGSVCELYSSAPSPLPASGSESGGEESYSGASSVSSSLGSGGGGPGGPLGDRTSPLAESLASLVLRSSGAQPSDPICSKDNLERLVEAISPLYIASMGSA